MLSKNQIEQSLEQIQQMQVLYRQVRDAEVLPFSFFSSVFDILKNLTTSLHEMESTQLDAMQKLSMEHESVLSGMAPLLKPSAPEPVPVESVKTEPVKKEIPEELPEKKFLSDAIEKKLLTDLKKAISLNDTFLYRRELFGGDSGLMDQTLSQLEGFASFHSAMAFLDENFGWNWTEEPAFSFRELLEKRFL